MLRPLSNLDRVNRIDVDTTSTFITSNDIKTGS